ncbi:MAG: methyltransferase domain-containing protein [Anaerolineales bacterium]|nr:methyltransferase domain-containing protein [Anaerolineales bacterium]
MKPGTAPEITFTHDRLARLANIESWHFWFAGRISWLTRTLRRYPIKNDDFVLDLGCGTGTTFQFLTHLGYRTVGIDLRPEGLRSIVNTLDETNLVQAEVAQIPFYANMFDVIIMLDVFEHVDARSAILEVSRVLKPGGWLILTVPAMDWLWSYRDQAAGHRQRFSKGQLTDLLAPASLQPVEIRYYQFFLFPMVIFSRLLARRFNKVRDLEEIRIPLVNSIFATINKMEVRLGDVIPWPWGSSIFAVFQKVAP